MVRIFLIQEDRRFLASEEIGDDPHGLIDRVIDRLGRGKQSGQSFQSGQFLRLAIHPLAQSRVLDHRRGAARYQHQQAKVLLREGSPQGIDGGDDAEPAAADIDRGGCDVAPAESLREDRVGVTITEDVVDDLGAAGIEDPPDYRGLRHRTDDDLSFDIVDVHLVGRFLIQEEERSLARDHFRNETKHGAYCFVLIRARHGESRDAIQRRKLVGAARRAFVTGGFQGEGSRLVPPRVRRPEVPPDYLHALEIR